MAEPIGCGDQYTVTLLVYPEELETRADLNHTEFPESPRYLTASFTELGWPSVQWAENDQYARAAVHSSDHSLASLTAGALGWVGPSQWAPTRGGRCSSTRSGSRGRTSCPCWRRSPRRRLRRGSMGRLPRRPAGRKRRRVSITVIKLLRAKTDWQLF